MKKIMIMGIICVLIVVVALIGVLGYTKLTSSTNSTATYNDGVIMFSYPSNLEKPAYNTTSNNTTSVWNYTILTDNTTSILLGKTSTIPSPLISSSLMSKYLQTGYGQILSNVTVSTNPNGVQIYRYTYKADYTNVTYYYMDFANKNNSTVYDVSVYGNETAQSQNIANQIFNSIKSI